MSIYDEKSNYRYKYSDNKIVERTESEKFNIETEKENKINQLKNKIASKLIEADQEYINKKIIIDDATDKTALDDITI